LQQGQNSGVGHKTTTIFTTEDELYKAISDVIQEQNADQSTKEVLRYREALWAGYEALKKEGRISTEAILKIFRNVNNTKIGFRPPHALVIKRGQVK
jgi:hypothetical protein